MKSGTIAVVLAGFVVAAGITHAFVYKRASATDQKPTLAANAAALSGLIHVDDLVKMPQGFRGHIVLRAVVARVNKPQGVFGVIDAREYESCGSLSCCDQPILPIKFAGDLPEPKTFVRITGRVARSEKGLVFEARGVEVLP